MYKHQTYSQALCIIALMFLFSCVDTTSRNNHPANSGNNTVITTTKEDTHRLDSEVMYQNIERQFKEYQRAMLYGDNEKLYDFIFDIEGITRRTQERTPQSKIDKQYMLDSVFGYGARIYKKLLQKGAVITFQLDSITCKQKYKDFDIWKVAFTASIVIANKGNANKSSLICVSGDGGANWQFLDCEGEDIEELLSDHFGPSISNFLVHCK